MIKSKSKHREIFAAILAVAMLFKLSIFIFGALKVPDSIFDSDSDSYLLTAQTIHTQGVFGVQKADGNIKFETFRTPGYPVFLAIFHNFMGFPLTWIIFLQLLLTIAVGFVTYKLALNIDSRIGLLAMAISLFDPPASVYSLKILTEALYLFALVLFLHTFVKYLKIGSLYLVILSGVTLALTAYIRPISYYLGIAVAIFMICLNTSKSRKKTILYTAIFLAVVFSIIGFWQLRNHLRTGNSSFADVIKANSQNHSLSAEVKRQGDQGLVSKGLDYLGTASSSFLNLMTLPGSLKYFNAKSFAKVAKVVFYIWMVFWMIGFLVGCVAGRRNIYFRFLLWVIAYFAVVTVINISEAAGERFRIPMVPCIAVVSAYGWLVIKDYCFNLKNGKKHTCCTK